jgi:hypothetical protein
MPPFFIALLIVVAGFWLIKKSSRMAPSAVPAFMQKLAGGAALAFAGLLMLRGQVQLATTLLVFGMGLYGKAAIFPTGFNWGKGNTVGKKSHVATSLLTMELDRDSGGIDGEIVAGPFRGRKLSALNDVELRLFYDMCRTTPDQSLALLEAWVSRNKPKWRHEFHDRGSTSTQTRSSSTMTKDEALAVLGLNVGALPEAVKQAHKKLMKNFHPDAGGSDYLAAKINQAKDILSKS